MAAGLFLAVVRRVRPAARQAHRRFRQALFRRHRHRYRRHRVLFRPQAHRAFRQVRHPVASRLRRLPRPRRKFARK